MKKTLLFLFVFASFVAKSQIQYGGVIRAQDNTGAPGNIKRTNDALKTFDSSLAAKLSGTLNVSGTFVPVNGGAIGTLTASDAVVGAPDGLGTIINGTSTAGSIVYMTMASGFQAWTLMIKGYTSGTVYTESSMNSTNGTDGDWVDLKGRRTGTAPGTESVTYAQVSNGVYRGNGAGFIAIRARLIGATGVGITFSSSNGAGAVFLNSGIPTGGSIIGKVGIDQTTPGTTNGVQITNPYTVLATDSSKYRSTIQISNLPATQAISAVSLPLPTGASTSALQTTGNTSLNSIDTKTPALGQTAMATSVPVTIASNQTTLVTKPAIQTATGSLTAVNQAVTFVLQGEANTTFQVSGTWVGTLNFEASNDGFTVVSDPINALRAGQATISQTITEAGNNDIYRCTTAGFGGVRIRVSAFTSGTIVITANTSFSTSGVFLNFPLPAGANTIGAISNTAFTANAGTGTFQTNITNASLPVTGTFFQTTQPVSMATAPTTPVTGTFFQATQPVSGTVSVSNTAFQATTATTTAAPTYTTGTTNPLSTTVTGNLRVDGSSVTQPVSGTFFQATQPVSLATNTPTLQSGSTTAVTQATAANLNATVVGNGTFAVQNTAALPTGANTIGAISNTTFAATQATPANLQATVTQQAITKGTQGTTGVSTQDLKDAGRNQVHYYMVIPVLTSATDALQSLTGTKSGATVLATATPAVVTAGKTFRVTRMAATYIATATSGYGIVRLRFNTAGVVTITSPVAATIGVGSGAPVTANATSSEEATLDEGWEFAAGTGVGISVQGFAAATATAVGYIFVSLTGYEY
jgi:hypothetical protein